MRLPGAKRALVSERKVKAYLLSPNHPIGRHKAAWLIGHGFAPARWIVAARAFQRHGALHDVASMETTPFGTRYVVEGELVTPDGRGPLARSVWFIEAGSDTPQFVTIYPLRGRRR